MVDIIPNHALFHDLERLFHDLGVDGVLEERLPRKKGAHSIVRGLLACEMSMPDYRASPSVKSVEVVVTE